MRAKRTCDFDGCAQPLKAKGYCAKHYRRLLKYGSAAIVLANRTNGAACCVPTCERPAKSKGYCDVHYKRVRAHGDPQADWAIKQGWRPWYKNALVPGTRRIDGQGYMRINLPGHVHATYAGGWAFEHRVVMSDSIGRPLFADEIVHHKNGDRTDNRIENLELCVKRQPPGQRAVDALAWAREIVERYDGKLFM